MNCVDIYLLQIEQKDLDTIIQYYPFFHYGENYWDHKNVYFKNKDLGDSELSMSYNYVRTPDGVKTTVNVSNRGGSMCFDLILDGSGGTLKCITGRITKEMYFMFFDYNIDVKNHAEDTTPVKRLWHLNKILSND